MLLFSTSMGASAQTLSSDASAFWLAARQPDTILMMRHALAPGNGDPMEVVIGDCSTQRNLSEEGRQQARDAGELLKLNGIANTRVYTSQWCRCVETAELLSLGEVMEQPSLNSFFGRYALAETQTQETLKWLKSLQQLADQDQQVILLVSHQVNITALTGVFPASGEIVAVRLDSSGKLGVVGRLETR